MHAALAPGAIIAELGNDAQLQLLDEVAAGGRLLAFAHLEPGQRSPAATVSTRAVRQGDSWLLIGTKNPVLAGDCADTLVVSAALPDGGVGLFLVNAGPRAVGSTSTRTRRSTVSAVRRSTWTRRPRHRWATPSTRQPPFATPSSGSSRRCAPKRSVRWKKPFA
ncbi:acyl-CoA dehydrogenase, middle domain protein [Mycobacterium ulcerans str. Harvey]|uniref:Acyl-CoA dehydrogenase, middle domain protein n=1 Tax=Mycobacterium ulcerans str. Harvey TaxID=1299332 RepID=A0ABN0QS16_MYCUL|nr:acyl-CoA dehydrogenase, middle domain protein [Mycobacterium ulcerans str. Harvey]